jgi:FMN reductase (NADPH)/FMN reductase [NAD(P)H]
MINETLKVIENRRSIRKYASTPLTADEKQTILHAALRAPTAGNMMLYSIIEVEDQALKDRLAQTCDDQPFIASAPWVLLFVADYQRFFDFYTFSDVESACAEKGITPRLPGNGDLLLASCDALIAAQTAVIAAESLGIGSCYIGDILENSEIHREMFNLPQYTLPITLLVFGRPFMAKNENRVTPRYDQQFVVFKNKYHRLSSEEFVKMNEHTAAHAYPNLTHEEAAKTLAQNNYFRKFVADFSIEMNRSSRVWIEAWNNPAAQ